MRYSFSLPTAMRYSFIEQHRHQHAIGLQCRVLKVSVSGYYAWRTPGEDDPKAGERNRTGNWKCESAPCSSSIAIATAVPVFSANCSIRECTAHADASPD